MVHLDPGQRLEVTTTLCHLIRIGEHQDSR
jgi:hypothetical protein